MNTIQLTAIRTLVTFLAGTALATALDAQTPRFVRRVLPDGYASVEGPTVASRPWGVPSSRSMAMYAGSTLSTNHPVRIIGLRYRPDGLINATSAGSYDFTLDVSTSPRTPATRSLTFDDNHGGDRTRVFDGTLNQPASNTAGSPSPFILSVTFTKPFEWDPQCGSLVLDYNVLNGSPIANNFDGVPASAGPDVAQLYGAANVATAATVAAGAPVVELVLDTVTAPDGLLAMDGGTSNLLPWGHSAASDYRVQDVYDASAIGLDDRTRITAIAWRPDEGQSYQGATFDCRITMSTTSTAPGSLSMTFADNHGLDEQLVFEGALTMPASPASTGAQPFELVCELDMPFEYNPALGNLVVDVQVISHDKSITCDIDSVAVASEPVGRVYRASTNGTAWNATTANFAGLNVHVLGIVGEPVPTLPAARDARRAPSALNDPFNRDSSRAMFLYPASATATSKPIWIDHLAFRNNSPTNSFGPVTYTCTIDLSVAAIPAGPMSSTFEDNHGARRTRVFDGKFSIPYYATALPADQFPISVKLDSAWFWDPAQGPLIVDIRVTERNGDSHLVDAELNVGAYRVAARNANATVATANAQQGLVIRLGGTGGNALAEEYGSGCAGINGVPRCYTDSLPRLPNPDLDLLLQDGPAVSAAFVMLGLTEANQPLAGFGLPGCTGLNNREFGSILTFTDAAGGGSLALPLPDSPQLAGLPILQQWACLDPTANTVGISFSNGQRLVTSR